MHRAHRYVRALILMATLTAIGGPLVATAMPQDSVQIRVYDSKHHDYHNWDDREDRAYRNYLEERHHTYVTYDHQNHRSQNDYWKWRHNHPDHN
jgi:hypothetical protein